MKFWFY